MGRVIRAVGAIVLLLACGCGSSGGSGEPADAASTRRGYVVSSFSYVFPEHGEDPCPGGFTKGPLEMRLDGDVVLPDDCDDPASVSDPGFKALDGPGRLPGFDLDGQVSSLASPGADECAHDDFSRIDGEPGIDYQLWRAVGCIRGFQQGDLAHTVIEEAVVNGSMTILLDLAGVDDERDDAEVSVRVYGSTDVPAIGADRQVLPFATLSVHEDERYHGSAGTGEIVDGVLTAGPMDVNLRFNIQIVDSDQGLRDAYLRLEFREDGTVQGNLSGFQVVEEAYDIFGRQAGRAGAEALSYTCAGLWEALETHADGGFDPETGRCSTISVAYRFEAVPAFVAK